MNKINKEIELRGLLEKDQYLNLIEKLSSSDCVHKKDDKLSYFFARENGIFKLNDEISKNQARISLKLGDEEKGNLNECEVLFGRQYFNNLLFIFQSLGFSKFHIVEQKRDNYYLKDLEVELALKYTPDFKYHFELEYLGDKYSSDEEIKNYLKEICKKLEIKPMEEDELMKKIKDIKKRHGLLDVWAINPMPSLRW